MGVAVPVNVDSVYYERRNGEFSRFFTGNLLDIYTDVRLSKFGGKTTVGLQTRGAHMITAAPLVRRVEHSYHE